MLVTKENPYPLQSRSHMRQIRAESGPRGPAKSGTTTPTYTFVSASNVSSHKGSISCRCEGKGGSINHAVVCGPLC